MRAAQRARELGTGRKKRQTDLAGGKKLENNEKTWLAKLEIAKHG